MQEQETQATRVWVLHPDIKSSKTRRDPDDALEEGCALARAMPNFEVVGSEVVPLSKMRAGYLFGSGKINEIGERIHDQNVELVLVDGPLTPVQQRNLEKAWNVKILDRTGLILEIFSDRARTREGVLQVEMAALSYQRTRLVRAWTHLERQRGGLGFVGGPGETQIEADRRAIDDAIGRIKKQLEKVAKTRALHRESRKKVPYPIVALVGYTNAGKSTLFNRLTGAEVFAKDMLFATLDPTMRSLTLPDETDIILSDTVGFISDLPHHLVAAFRATLEEVLDADLIVHVRDISHPLRDSQSEDVAAILAQLGVDDDTPQLEVWNKIDQLSPQMREGLEEAARHRDNVIMMSAQTGEGYDGFVQAVSASLVEPRIEEDLLIPYAAGRQRAWLFEEGLIKSEDPTDAGFKIRVLWNAREKERFWSL
ncbi:MAG: GTPase HflX [Halocynthiibacter sp.]